MKTNHEEKWKKIVQNVFRIKKMTIFAALAIAKKK
jgi:hypothetical protein